jgi:hypothetical protein
MGVDVDDIFDIGITFINGNPVMPIFTDLPVILDEYAPNAAPAPISLSIIMDEEESKVEQIFNVNSDEDGNLDETLSIDLIVCLSCNRQNTRKMVYAVNHIYTATSTVDGRDQFTAYRVA